MRHQKNAAFKRHAAYAVSPAPCCHNQRQRHDDDIAPKKHGGLKRRLRADAENRDSRWLCVRHTGAATAFTSQFTMSPHAVRFKKYGYAILYNINHKKFHVRVFHVWQHAHSVPATYDTPHSWRFLFRQYLRRLIQPAWRPAACLSPRHSGDRQREIQYATVTEEAVRHFSTTPARRNALSPYRE